MEKDKIIIRGARVNNLKNIDLDIPRNQLVIMTGLSGSGKTSLAFDTIYAEGQRRYVESLSAYARQFLGNTEKPDVDVIEGLSPAIAIDQKTTSNNPRSTVGTVTEIYDYLRLLYARAGSAFCPIHHIEIRSQTIPQMVDQIEKLPEKTKLMIIAPVISDKKGSHKSVIEDLSKNGYVRVRVDGNITLIEELEELDKNKRHTIEAVIDRIVLKDGITTRLFDSLEIALKLGKGNVDVLADDELLHFSSNHSCPHCGFSIDHLEPRLFSFNASLGACEKCKGLGVTQHVDINLLMPDQSLSIAQGGIAYFKNTVNTENMEWQQFNVLLETYKLDINKPLADFTKKEMDLILWGSKKPINYSITSRSGSTYNKTEFVEGIAALIERRFPESQSEFYRDWVSGFMSEQTCDICNGHRLNEKALSVKIGDLNIFEFTEMSVDKALDYLANLKLDPTKKEISRLVVKEIGDRFKFLSDVGLKYLKLSRSAGSLSGGEAQRIRLATQIGSQLTGVLYVLDEPSIGLHQRDNAMLIKTLKNMRDLGNSLIVVEHDEDTMWASDYVIDIGPGAGLNGGEVIAVGTPQEVSENKASITGQYLSHVLSIPVPKTRRKGNGKVLKVVGAQENNLKNINVEIPLGTMCVVTGVSGSGKSSLVNEVIGKSLANHLNRVRVTPGLVKKITGLENLDKLVVINQSPIGRTPRSNPATYTGVFDQIRDVFATTIEAKTMGYTKSRFSFNVKGGRCEACQGDGIKKIAMHFLPDVYVPCAECGGKRYNDQTLQVKYKEKSIYEVLEMSVEEGVEFFKAIPSIHKKLKTLLDVGLGYIKLGQSSTTLSGGEAQRVKLASELQKVATGKTMFILDEPTTGLHTHDVSKLINVIERIVDNGDSVMIIEHNLDIIKTADWVIDLGPEGGDEGGTLVAKGTPEQIAKVKSSYTGQYLKNVL